MQGDKEREIGLSVSPLMDRKQQGGMVRSQVSLAQLAFGRWLTLPFSVLSTPRLAPL